MTDEISWHVELEVKPGELENFRELTREMVETTRKESGVVVYERFISQDGKTVHIYERFVDSEAAVSHLEAFTKLYGERFSGMVSRRLFTVFGTPSDDLKRLLDGFGATYMKKLDGFSVLETLDTR